LPHGPHMPIKPVPVLALSSDAQYGLRKLGAALVLQWSELSPELKSLLLDQASKVQLVSPELESGVRAYLERLVKEGWENA
jgi:hypothetical protein